MSQNEFDPMKLSVREREILDGAIEGMTDIQIALRVGISPSTVNSYWVRIRGKLGQLSRTELVALALKKKANDEMNAMTARLTALQDEAKSHTRTTSDYTNAEIFAAALDAMPEAMLILCHQGLIRYANARMEALFGYREGELLDQPLSILVPAASREAEGERLAAYIENPHPLRIGLDRVVYGQRRDGSLLRVVLLVDSRPVAQGPIFSCIVRDFGFEVDVRRSYAQSA